MNTFKVNGIHVNDHGGKGEPLIFIHAYPLCSRMWDKQAEYFNDRFRVITYDIRGLGYSNELESYLFTMEDLVDDLENILNHIKLDKVNACGLSVGGYILLRSAERMPERFSSLILADTKAESDDHDSMLNRSAGIKKIRSGMKDEFIEAMLPKLISNEGFNNPEINNKVREMMGWMDVNGMCSVMIAIATRTNLINRLKNISIPSLVIVGKEDALTPVIHSFYLKENLRNAKYHLIKNAGHISNMEKPEEFNKALEEFLLSV